MMLLAQGETTTWQMVAMSLIVLIGVPLTQALIAWIQTRSLNASSKVRSDNLGDRVEQSTEKLPEKIATKMVEKAGTGSALYPPQRGEQGEQGERGERGPKGDRGAAG